MLVNNYDITYEATQYLINKGYKRIAHLTGPIHINVFNERQKGYVDALNKNGLLYNRLIALNEDFTPELGEKCLSDLFQEDQKPDAIISSSILLTMGLAVRARELSLKIPNDLALIGFGNHLSSLIMQPQLTSIYQSETEIASSSFDLLEKMIKKEISLGENFIQTIQAQIVFRESC